VENADVQAIAQQGKLAGACHGTADGLLLLAVPAAATTAQQLLLLPLLLSGCY
jgi:hypothetical protein